VVDGASSPFASLASLTSRERVSSVMKFLEKSKRISLPSASFLKVWLNLLKRSGSAKA
jgi:hypothetical protein